MSTISVINVKHPSSASSNLVTDSSGNTTAAGTVAMGSSFLRNRIINGDMVIDQRNAGASVTPASGAYTVDRWAVLASQASKFSIQQNAGAVTPPNGFKNYLGVTSLSSYSIVAGDFFSIFQIIEGYNIADLGWGASGASTVTLSFWVRSSLTGTFGGVVSNQYTGSGRYYPFTYTISAANTWEQKTITIAGDITGTWGSTNGNGIVLQFGLGVGSTYNSAAGSWTGTYTLGATGATSVVGTNGATFYITGVQLEVGTVATPFERRLYGTELYLCQRYLQRLSPTTSSTNPFMATAAMFNSTVIFPSGQFTQPMRSVPTLVLEGAASNYSFFTMSSGSYIPAVSLTLNSVTTNTFFLIQGSVSTGATTGHISYLTGYLQNTLGIQFSAEL